MINLQWGTQKNGRIDTALLVDVSGRGDYLEPTAAAQFKRMQAAIKRDVDFDLQPASGSSAYRPEAIQIEFFTERYTKVSYNSGLWWNGSYWTKKPGVAVAAIPDTSNHGWARAIDLNISQLDRKAWAWMLAHAAEYGFSWATGKASGEDWHWESLTPPGTVVAASAGATPLTPRAPTQEEIDEMTATPDARIIRDYVTENTTGKTTTALIYPDGTAVRLNDHQDVDGACLAFAKTYSLPETINRGDWPADKYPGARYPRHVYGIQLTKQEWAAFFAAYPATKKIGF